MRTTPDQLLPYPVGSDAGNGARQLQDIAELLETKLTRLDAEWSDRISPWGWQARTTSSQGSFSANGTLLTWHVVDFDNHGALAPVNSGNNQVGVLGTSGRWETWYIGAYLNFSGGTTLDQIIYASLEVTSLDPLTNVSSLRSFERVGVWSNTAGEHMVVDAYARVREGTVAVRQFSEGAGTKTVAIGASFWACRVGVE